VYELIAADKVVLTESALAVVEGASADTASGPTSEEAPAQATGAIDEGDER
jgi:hypothetical protein